MRPARRLIGAFAWLVGVNLLPAPLMAQPRSPHAAAAALPAQAEVALVLDGASRIRTSLAGESIRGALADSGLLEESDRAWEGLARVLGLRRDDAFDALLGRRVILVMTGIRPGIASQWAVVSQVSPEIERRLRAGLGAAPRQVVGGQPILSVENGRYELASAVFKDAGASPLLKEGGPAEPVALMLLAPAGHNALFDAMLPLIQGRAAGEPFGATLQPASAHGAADGLVIARLLSADGRSDRYAAVALHAGADTWKADTIAWPANLWLPGIGAGPVAGLSRPVFDALSRDALVSVVGTLGTDGPPRELITLAGTAAHLAWPDGLDALPAGSAILTVHSGEGDSGDPFGLAVSVAVQVRDVEASAKTCDRAVARSLSAAGRDGAADFGGFLPGAIRTAEVGVGPGRTSTIAWTFQPDAQPRIPDAPRSGWWVMALGPTGKAPSCSISIVRRTTTALTAPDGKADPRRRISLGIVRPARAVEFVLRGADIPSGPFALVRAIDSAEWDAWIEGDTIRAESTVRFSPVQSR